MKTAYQIAVARLRIAPSEFWQMKPRHFWWLADTLQENTKRKGFDADERAQMLRLIDDANKGKK